MDAIRIPPPAELDSLDDEHFRQVVRAFLQENYPEELRNPPKRLHWNENKPWYMKLAERGWLCPGWPKEHGGLGLSPAKQIILTEEYERHGVARTNDHGIVMLGPLVIKYGTEEQKKFFLPKILSGEHIWCQGYSEPNAGSDLAALRTEAVLDGDHYVVNGQKIWTTLAMDANWIFLLVRTDKNAKKQEGISFLLVDMKSPGITVRPIINLEMHDEFCETFFDDVRVPKENLVGELNKGWDVAKYLLTHEREMISGIGLSAGRPLGQVAADSIGTEDGMLANPLLRGQIAAFDIDAAAFQLALERVGDLAKAKQGHPAMSSMLKYYGAELNKRRHELLMSAGGSDALEWEGERSRGGDRARSWLRTKANSIEGGTSEVQLNIIAKRLLELPGA